MLLLSYITFVIEFAVPFIGHFFSFSGTIICTIITGTASIRPKLPFLAVCVVVLTAITDLLGSFCSSFVSFAIYAAVSGVVTMSYFLLRTIVLQVWSHLEYYQNLLFRIIHRNPVADGWAGAVTQKPIAIQKCDGRTDRNGKVSATKNTSDYNLVHLQWGQLPTVVA